MDSFQQHTRRFVVRILGHEPPGERPLQDRPSRGRRPRQRLVDRMSLRIDERELPLDLGDELPLLPVTRFERNLAHRDTRQRAELARALRDEAALGRQRRRDGWARDRARGGWSREPALVERRNASPVRARRRALVIRRGAGNRGTGAVATRALERICTTRRGVRTDRGQPAPDVGVARHVGAMSDQ